MKREARKPLFGPKIVQPGSMYTHTTRVCKQRFPTKQGHYHIKRKGIRRYQKNRAQACLEIALSKVENLLVVHLLSSRVTNLRPTHVLKHVQYKHDLDTQSS